MDVKIETIESMRVAFMLHVGPYEQVGQTWGQLCAWAGPRGLLGPKAKMLGVSHDDPNVTPPEKLRYDACIVVDDSVQSEGEVGGQEVAGGEYAVVTHHGPYERLNEIYGAIFGQWLPTSGRELLAICPCFEVYLNSPENTAPDKLLTDIHVPLKPR